MEIRGYTTVHTRKEKIATMIRAFSELLCLQRIIIVFCSDVCRSDSFTQTTGQRQCIDEVEHCFSVQYDPSHPSHVWGRYFIIPGRCLSVGGDRDALVRKPSLYIFR